MSKIRAVLFDMGGTLVKVESAPEIYARILKAKGVNQSIKRLTAAWEQAQKSLDYTRMPELGARYWVELNLLILNNLGIVDKAEHLAKILDSEWWNYARVTLYPEASAVLHDLRQRGLKIGFITNSFDVDIRKILQKLGLEGFFDVEIGVDSIGKSKPAEQVFLHAAEKLGIQPADILFVGDDLDADYRGASSVGMKAVLIDREGKILDNIVKVTTLLQVLSFVA